VFSPVKKDRWFYDQFEYCLAFTLQEASVLRNLDHDIINEILEQRQQWREISRKRWGNSRLNLDPSLQRRWPEITEKTSVDLHTVADVLLSMPSAYKLVVSMNSGYIYTNDLTVIDRLAVMPELTFKYYTQAQIHRPKNTVQLKNCRHQFRSYFKLQKLTAAQKDSLMDFLHNQKNHVRLSPGLSRWFDSSFTRTQDYFFVDHDTQSWLTMLALVQPGLVRKTVHIIPAK
jgi:hypothetical protein